MDKYILNIKRKTTNLIGRVPIQVKGTKKPITSDMASFSCRVADLRNYCNDGGCIFFLVSVPSVINETRQVAPINAGDYPDYSVTFDFVLSEDKTEFTCGTDDREKSKHFKYYIAIPKLCRCICTAAKECIRKHGKDAFTGNCRIYSSWKWQQDYLEEMGE